MERVSNLTPKVNLSTYGELISALLPFVIIRCVKYTNSKRLAETIAVYSLVSSYLARMQDNRAGIPIVIGCMTDVVGEDLAGGPNVNGPSLFENINALCAAKALVGLGMEECLALVLYYIEKLDLGGMAVITGKSIDEMMGIIGKAQRLFLENLERFQPRGTIVLEGEIRRRMDSVADSFDRGQFERIINTVMDYLIRQN